MIIKVHQRNCARDNGYSSTLFSYWKKKRPFPISLDFLFVPFIWTRTLFLTMAIIHIYMQRSAEREWPTSSSSCKDEWIAEALCWFHLPQLICSYVVRGGGMIYRYINSYMGNRVGDGLRNYISTYKCRTMEKNNPDTIQISPDKCWKEHLFGSYSSQYYGYLECAL